MSQLPVAYASSASAAIPLVLSPITLKNYAGQCGYETPRWLLQARKSENTLRRTRAKELLSYLDVEKRPHVHLLDGGLSDNIALRGILEGTSVTGGLEAVFQNAGVKQVKKLVILSVNAETSPDIKEYRSDEIPVFTRSINSLVDIPINRYSADTLLLTRFAVEMWRNNIRKLSPSVEAVLGRDAEIYFIDANLGRIDDPVEQEYLMKIPTTLYLTDEQIDRLLLAASRLIYRDPAFQRLMNDLQKRP
jgi:NTE family protein